MLYILSVTMQCTQQKVGMDPTFFGFRWITLLLSQEFLLPGNYLHDNLS